MVTLNNASDYQTNWLYLTDGQRIIGLPGYRTIRLTDEWTSVRGPI